MIAKTETSDYISLDYDLYRQMKDTIFFQAVQLEKVRKVAKGWKSMNGQHRAYGDTILRILDNQD